MCVGVANRVESCPVPPSCGWRPNQGQTPPRRLLCWLHSCGAVLIPITVCVWARPPQTSFTPGRCPNHTATIDGFFLFLAPTRDAAASTGASQAQRRRRRRRTVPIVAPPHRTPPPPAFRHHHPPPLPPRHARRGIHRGRAPPDACTGRIVDGGERGRGGTRGDIPRWAVGHNLRRWVGCGGGLRRLPPARFPSSSPTYDRRRARAWQRSDLDGRGGMRRQRGAARPVQRLRLRPPLAGLQA